MSPDNDPQKLRIAMLAYRGKPHVGGQGVYVREMSKALVELGHTVEVFERSDRIGGLMMYGIPNMKLDKSILDMRIDIMEKEGIIFHKNTDIGASDSLSLEDLIHENDSVLLTTGATKPRDLTIPCREGDGVHFAMEFLGKNTKSLLDSKLKNSNYLSAKDKDVIVIGGGDTGTA